MYNKEFELLFKLAKDRVEDIEIFLNIGKSFSVRIHRQNVDSFNYADNKGIGIRLIKDGKVGYSYTEEFSENAFSNIIDEAIAGSIYVENTDPVIIAKHPDIDTKLDLYSPGLNNINVDEKIQVAKDLERLALEKDSRVFNVPAASYSDGYKYVRVANSQGLDKEYEANHCVAMVMVLANEGQEKKSGHWYYFGRDFEEIDVAKIADKAVSKAIELLNSSSPTSGEYPVVLSNEMVTSLLATFSGIFSAKNVQEGKSMFRGKIGSQLADSCITLYDDGLFPNGLATSPFDNEGYPSQKTVLIDKGILKNLLHNTVTAGKDNTKSTGNGSRSIKGSLNVSNSNMIIEPGNHSPQDLYKSAGKVIKIVSLQGLHSGANPISGDFSLSAEGLLYENGKRTKSLSNFTLSGNFYQLLMNTKLVGNDFLMSYTACGAPSLLIDKLVISSK